MYLAKQEQSHELSIESFPPEILYIIFSSLNYKDFISLSLVDKFFKAIITTYISDDFRKHYLNHFFKLPKNITYNINFKLLFLETWSKRFGTYQIRQACSDFIDNPDNTFEQIIKHPNFKQFLEFSQYHKEIDLLNKLYDRCKQHIEKTTFANDSEKNCFHLTWALECHQEKEAFTVLYKLYHENYIILFDETTDSKGVPKIQNFYGIVCKNDLKDFFIQMHKLLNRKIRCNFNGDNVFEQPMIYHPPQEMAVTYNRPWLIPYVILDDLNNLSTLYHLIAESGNTDFFKIIEKIPNYNDRDVMQRVNADAVSTMTLEKCIDVVDRNGNTALSIAISKNDLTMMTLFIEKAYASTKNIFKEQNAREYAININASEEVIKYLTDLTTKNGEKRSNDDHNEENPEKKIKSDPNSTLTVSSVSIFNNNDNATNTNQTGSSPSSIL